MLSLSNNYFLWRILALIGSLSLLCCCQKPKPFVMPPTPVKATHIEAQTIPANFEYIGVAESSHIVELRARVEGYLEKIAYKEGDLVQTNQLMFVLDQRPFMASLASAEGVLARQRALLWNAQQIKARMIPLYQQNAISQRDLDNALADEYAAEANVMTAGANVESAALNLGFASIAAPVTGLASRAIFREGALIAPGPDSLLTNIYVIDPIWVNFSVSEGDLLQARRDVSKNLLKYPPNMNFKIEIIMADDTILPAEGTIDFTDPALQQNTGTMLVRSVLANPQGWLRPGQFVRVVVKGAIRPNAIIVPQTAVMQGQNGLFVYVISNDNKATTRLVDAGGWYQNFWIINSGLKQGDVVIVEGVNKVQNSSPVQVTQWISNRPSTNDTNSYETNHLGF